MISANSLCSWICSALLDSHNMKTVGCDVTVRDAPDSPRWLCAGSTRISDLPPPHFSEIWLLPPYQFFLYMYEGVLSLGLIS